MCADKRGWMFHILCSLSLHLPSPASLFIIIIVIAVILDKLQTTHIPDSLWVDVTRASNASSLCLRLFELDPI